MNTDLCVLSSTSTVRSASAWFGPNQANNTFHYSRQMGKAPDWRLPWASADVVWDISIREFSSVVLAGDTLIISSDMMRHEFPAAIVA